ncbi:MAG: MFS transporter [Coriobacteriales bacterium]
MAGISRDRASEELTVDTVQPEAPRRLGLVLAVYLLGLAIGGLYVGMVAPVRTVVQLGFGLDDAAGIWMINIYTLFYAALIPVIGKVADRRGRNRIFALCVAVFMVGSILCGLSASIGGFALLLVGRVVQAAGAGGMIPVANAEIGTSFPEGKRGMALGIAAAVSGLSNVLGAGAGSAIIGLVGVENWPVMFYVSVPLCAILLIGTRALPRNAARPAVAGRMDYAGSVLFVLFVLLLLLGLKELDFFSLPRTIAQPGAWGPLVGAVACVVVFGLVERRAASPVFHMEYLRSRPIVITMIASFFIGCVVIAMMMVPEYAEFVMGDTVGSGGYYMLAVGITSMVGPPLGGKLIDRFGPRPVLLFGLAVMVAGYSFLALRASLAPSVGSLVFGLAVVGFGMGFAMGAPTNYMILENTRDEDSASALIATIALVRQVGTTVAPAIFVGFISAGNGILGYQQMLLCVAVFSALAAVVTLFYRSPGK